MKKWIVFVILLCAALTGCRQIIPSQVVATTLPVYDFSVALCENTGISVSRLVTEQVSCLHDYTIQVSQMRSVESAQVVVQNGAGLEAFLEDILANTNGVIDASIDIETACGDTHEGHHHEHDPHIWLSPTNAKQMCKTICAGLTAQFPAHRAQFETNLQQLLLQLDNLQAYGEATLKDLSCRDLITFHDGFAYFADSFDLHILKAVEEESGSEASANELTVLAELVNANRLPAIFTEENGSTASAEIIARETGIRIFTLDMGMAKRGYFDAMYHNIDTIKEALG